MLRRRRVVYTGPRIRTQLGGSRCVSIDAFRVKESRPDQALGLLYVERAERLFGYPVIPAQLSSRSVACSYQFVFCCTSRLFFPSCMHIHI